jgi:hypothetical protein
MLLKLFRAHSLGVPCFVLIDLLKLKSSTTNVSETFIRKSDCPCSSARPLFCSERSRDFYKKEWLPCCSSARYLFCSERSRDFYKKEWLPCSSARSLFCSERSRDFCKKEWLPCSSARSLFCSERFEDLLKKNVATLATVQQRDSKAFVLQRTFRRLV